MDDKAPLLLYEKLLNAIPEVVCILDKDYHFVYVSLASKENWGYEPSELVGRSCLDFIVERDKPFSCQTMSQLIKYGITTECENEYYHKNGSIVAMSWRGRWDQHDGFLYTTGNNVTQKRAQEKEMEMLSLIAKQTVNSIIVMDAQRRITWVNEAFVRTTGFTFEEALGQRPSELFCGPDTDLELVQLTIERIQQGDAASIEVKGYTKYGQPFWSAIQFQPLFDKHGVLNKIVAIINDITEKRRLRDQLDQEVTKQQKRITAAVIQAQEDERAQLGRELHDNVNQVLTTVKLFNEIIAENVTDHKELVQKSSGYLQSCINEIRRISKRLSIPPLSEVGLIELMRELVDSINLTNKLEVSFSLKGMHEVPISQEMQLAIYRIMQEQLNNVIKHAGAGTVMIALICHADQLILSIKDDGIGFDANTKRKGIGITNIKSRAESLDGSFYLDTAPGKGCLVRVCFPLVREVSFS